MLEEFLDKIEDIPQDLRDRFTWMREMDLSVYTNMNTLEKRSNVMFSLCEMGSLKSETADQEYESLRKCYYNILEQADDKCMLANQMHSNMVKILKNLDDEIYKFRSDNPDMSKNPKILALEADIDNRRLPNLFDTPNQYEISETVKNNNKKSIKHQNIHNVGIKNKNDKFRVKNVTYSTETNDVQNMNPHLVAFRPKPYSKNSQKQVSNNKANATKISFSINLPTSAAISRSDQSHTKFLEPSPIIQPKSEMKHTNISLPVPVKNLQSANNDIIPHTFIAQPKTTNAVNLAHCAMIPPVSKPSKKQNHLISNRKKLENSAGILNTSFVTKVCDATDSVAEFQIPIKPNLKTTSTISKQPKPSSSGNLNSNNTGNTITAANLDNENFRKVEPITISIKKTTGSASSSTVVESVAIPLDSNTSYTYPNPSISSSNFTEVSTDNFVNNVASVEEASTEIDDRKYCICNDISHGDMVACDNANCSIEWFHYMCVGITQTPKGKWYCPICRKVMRRRSHKKR